jgi:transposase
MRNALPVIREDAVTLKQRLPRAHDGRQKPRLQMLYVVASGHAQTRQAVAQRLGVHRHTVGHWLAIDEARCLDALLELSVPAGKPLSLPPGVLAALAQALRQPAGFASYEAVRQWVQQYHRLDVNDHTLYTIIRTKLQATLKRPRPRPPKNPDAIQEVQATCQERLERVMPPDNARPVRVFSQDDSRFGLLTVRRQRLTACGVQLVGAVPLLRPSS